MIRVLLLCARVLLLALALLLLVGSGCAALAYVAAQIAGLAGLG